MYGYMLLRYYCAYTFNDSFNEVLLLAKDESSSLTNKQIVVKLEARGYHRTSFLRAPTFPPSGSLPPPLFIHDSCYSYRKFRNRGRF